jgi:hypothetical protein
MMINALDLLDGQNYTTLMATGQEPIVKKLTRFVTTKAEFNGFVLG